jgi:hypothetical protein
MNWTRPRRTAVERVAALAAALCVCAIAQAAQLYKWTDADGRVTYGDKPPKGALNVTPIEVDTTTTTIPASPEPRAPGATKPARTEVAPGGTDILTQRRATRARLEQAVDEARAKLDLARKNLAEATDMSPDEQLSIVQKVQDINPPANQAPGPVDPANLQTAGGGMYGFAKRSNCSAVVGKSGKAAIVCPTIIPNTAYQERIAALEDAVRKAEADLDAAQTAYNRGVD